MEELKDEISSLNIEIDAGQEVTKSHSMNISQARLQIEALNNDLWKNRQYNDDLCAIIDAFNDPADRNVKVPF